MSTYYFFKVKKLTLPSDSNKISVQQQIIKDSKIDAPPNSIMELVDEKYNDCFVVYKCIHEKIERKYRRMAGNPEYFPMSVTGGDKPFFAYQNDKLIAFNAGKELVYGLVKTLHKNFPNLIDLELINVDFKKIMDNTPNMIIGSWFSGLKGKVKSVGLFGDHVNLDENFNRYNSIADMSMLYLDILTESSDDSINIGITKNGGIILYNGINGGTKSELNFLFNYLVPNLLQ